ncbi:hypothetical protein [Paraoerskovia marina]|uniref:hypothetical protein n=1 Tax=Paraoerskovia marina TaxID=545619 RepID=UPI000492466F|nr:hypothetical protein [Paraoerskovia marina]
MNSGSAPDNSHGERGVTRVARVSTGSTAALIEPVEIETAAWVSTAALIEPVEIETAAASRRARPPR